ncbi:MAG: S-ribosylhomocysteine lyase [Muribaculaceae bacterium]|nr:S-ribosylhomocysteine lyase [Muribaculaceae bacterium]
MKKIASFTVVHIRLLRVVYVSRRDTTPSGECITTFDVRMTEPNRQQPLKPETLHAMEHLAATYLRNEPRWSERVVYWGPMGCCTGNYLILQGHLEPADILDLLRDMFGYIAGFRGDVPGATPRDCGNYSFMNLDDARRQARIYLDEVLANPGECNLVYPSDSRG